MLPPGRKERAVLVAEFIGQRGEEVLVGERRATCRFLVHPTKKTNYLGVGAHSPGRSFCPSMTGGHLKRESPLAYPGRDPRPASPGHARSEAAEPLSELAEVGHLDSLRFPGKAESTLPAELGELVEPGGEAVPARTERDRGETGKVLTATGPVREPRRSRRRGWSYGLRGFLGRNRSRDLGEKWPLHRGLRRSREWRGRVAWPPLALVPGVCWGCRRRGHPDIDLLGASELPDAIPDTHLETGLEEGFKNRAYDFPHGALSPLGEVRR